MISKPLSINEDAVKSGEFKAQMMDVELVLRRALSENGAAALRITYAESDAAAETGFDAAQSLKTDEGIPPQISL